VASTDNGNGDKMALWKIILLVDFALLTALLLPAAFSIYRRRRETGVWLHSEGQPFEPLDDLLYVEGRSDEPVVGEFSGIAYAMYGPMDDEEMSMDAALFVRDEQRGSTVVVRLAEVQKMRPLEETGGFASADAEEAAGGAARSHTYRGQLGWPAARRTRRRQRAGEARARRQLARASVVSVGRFDPRAAIGASGGPGYSLPDQIVVHRVGARVDLERGDDDSGGASVNVNITLFAEGERRHWETRLEDEDTPFTLATDDLEEQVRRLVVPHKLGPLQEALARDGVEADRSDLENLPFMLEVGRRLERELARRLGERA
jgi:hypothetical protein